uniref:Conopeptide n=1 Tax=Conus lenavati TaxID=1519839 RepID=A0A0K8TUB4_CONLV
MFGHTSVSFLLLSIMTLVAAQTQLRSCSQDISSEGCFDVNETCSSCAYHYCCIFQNNRPPACMTDYMCTYHQNYGRRRFTQMQERFLPMLRRLAD